jgi:hypothetical protein
MLPNNNNDNRREQAMNTAEEVEELILLNAGVEAKLIALQAALMKLRLRIGVVPPHAQLAATRAEVTTKALELLYATSAIGRKLGLRPADPPNGA